MRTALKIGKCSEGKEQGQNAMQLEPHGSASAGTSSFAIQAHCFVRAIEHLRKVQLHVLPERVQRLGGLDGRTLSRKFPTGKFPTGASERVVGFSCYSCWLFFSCYSLFALLAFLFLLFLLAFLFLGQHLDQCKETTLRTVQEIGKFEAKDAKGCLVEKLPMYELYIICLNYII